MWKDVLGHCHDNPVELRIQFDSTKMIHKSVVFILHVSVGGSCQELRVFFVCVFPETAGIRSSAPCHAEWVREK